MAIYGWLLELPPATVFSVIEVFPLFPPCPFPADIDQVNPQKNVSASLAETGFPRTGGTYNLLLGPSFLPSFPLASLGGMVVSRLICLWTRFF